ncbi:hypothetical protein [Cellulomonas sp. ATA003]|uniref:hypothetical protein n=1 Tax=Cellulomonas sp. ATA003 TaxID=3073064 RepID=UPI002873E525|nr:hypothetical protein [Cellulomonas sp. ATA003]WNB84377.1 hypothetical protein REH70_10865 [Cellulomonas sp. ATA003]
MASDPLHLFPGKPFISTVLEALETKHAMSGRLARRYLQRAAMAGVIIGVLYVTNFAILAAFEQVAVGGPRCGRSGAWWARSRSGGRWSSSTTRSPSCSRRT